MTIIDTKTVWATASPSAMTRTVQTSVRKRPAPVSGKPPSGIDVNAPRSATAPGSLYRMTIKYVKTEQICRLPKALLL